MISKTDIEIYSEIFQEKSTTEKYLGYVSFDWVYSSVKYTADCALAIPFDLFDKVIVGILSIDEVLSIEQIGEILGMNLIHNPEQQIYKDEAEYDILRIALDNLKDYNMIEIGDTSYSSCRLTKDGKLFAAKGYKFRVEENKPFRLFFDHTSNCHEVAKKELETLKGTQIQLNNEYNFLDEVVMQNIAEVQVPEIHNPKLGNSFINPRIDTRKSASYILKVAAALLFDLETKRTRFIAFDTSSKRINQYFTDFINLNKQDSLNLFDKVTEVGILIEDKNSYLQRLIQDKRMIQSLLSTKPQEALVLSKKANTESEFIDQEYFWLNLSDFISEDTEEIFLLIPNVTELSISKIKYLVENKELPNMFIVFQESASEDVNHKMLELYQLSRNINNHLFAAVSGEVTSFEFLIKNKSVITKFEENTLHFISEEVNLSKPFYCKQLNTLNELPTKYNEIKYSFANDYLKIIENAVDEICLVEIEDDTINKSFILEQNLIATKANAFLNTKIDSDARASLDRLNNTIKKHITGIKNRHKLFLAEKLLQLSNSFEANTSDKLEDVVQFENKLKEIEAECFNDYKDISSAINVFKEKVQFEIKRIKDEVLAKTYIIDTNVFIKEPDIISKIDSKHYVALSFSVIDELDKLKVRPEIKENALKAIRNINSLLKTTKTNTKNRVRRQGADLTLLPIDLQNKSSDNMILSLGLVYRKQNHNPIILTLDRNFQSKAMMLDIPLVTLYELLGIKEEVKQKPKPIVKKENGIDYRRIFNEMKPNKKGEYHIKAFIDEVKKSHPDFDFKKNGFDSEYKFVTSLRIFQVSDFKYLKLK
jgi:hypothetical protein